MRGWALLVFLHPQNARSCGWTEDQQWMFTECKGVLRLSTPPRALLELSGKSFPPSELLCAYFISQRVS